MTTTTKERGMPFSAAMVLALLRNVDPKWQTRRIVKPQYLADKARPNHAHDDVWVFESAQEGRCFDVKSPYGRPGDLLRVKEAAWMWCEKRPNGLTKKGRPKWHYVPLRCASVFYCTDHPAKPMLDVVSPGTGQWGWRKKIGRFLPRWASRITLEIVAIRVERLQEISEEHAMAEGIIHDPHLDGFCYDAEGRGFHGSSAIRAYENLWRSINGPGSWETNPWVWCISFKRIEPDLKP